jgi:PAS domain S-box-containing protein
MLEALCQSETEAIERLVAALPHVLLELDDEGTILGTNEATESVLGYDTDTLVGKPIETVLAGGDTTETSSEKTPDQRTRFREAISNETPLDAVPVQFQTVDGSARMLAVSTVPAGDTTICLAEDSESDTEAHETDEKAGNKAHRDTPEDDRVPIEHDRKRYAELVETVGDPMYVLDDNGTIEQVNEAMVEYTGYERADLVGREISEIVPAVEYEQATAELADIARSDQDSTTFETQIVTRSGRLIISEANVRVLTDDDGTYRGSVGVLRDIHDRKQRERDLELLKQLLTRVFRHNVRNRLLVVQGHAEIIKEQTSEDIGEYADKIMHSADRLLDHTEKARDIEQVVELDRQETVDLTSTVNELVAKYRADCPETDIDFELPESRSVEAHPMLKTAIEELLDNAIQHAPEGETPTISIWTEQSDSEVTLFVEDESGGLTDHEIGVLRSGGENPLEHSSGVGLWLVYWIVESSGANMIAHRTDEGSLMGIKFIQEGTRRDAGSFTHPPAHLQDDPVGGNETVVGRRDELHRLEDIYDGLSKRGGHAVLLTGETGIGKTTLLDEFTRQLETQDKSPLVATGSCEPGMTPPYNVVRQVLEDVPASTDRQEWFEQRWQSGADDLETRQRRRETLFADVADELRTLSVDTPLVVILEDLQWADAATVELFEYLVDDIGQWALPILFVGTYRTDAVQSAHPVSALASTTEETDRREILPLEPLEPHDIQTILCELLDVETVPEGLVTDIHDHTGGNPQFVTELARHLADSLGPTPTPPTLPTSLDDITLPESLEGAATDRLDSLTAAVERVLEVGAIIGESISLDVLRRASDLPESTLLESIERLMEWRIWRETDEGFTFVHGVVRENTLSGLDEDRRRTLHKRVASAIESVYANSAKQYSRLAAHYQNAGEIEDALDYHERAGRHALESYAHEAALEHYQQVLELSAGTDRDSAVTAAHRLTEIYLTRSEYDSADEYVTFARERATETPQKQATARLAARIAIQQGEYETAIERAVAGLDIDDSETVEYCRLLGVKADAEWRKSDYEAAEETCETYRNLARELDDRSLQAEASEQLAKVLQERAEYDQSRTYYEQALELAQVLDDRHHEADVRTGLGVINKRQGRTQAAKRCYEHALDTYEELNDRHQAARIYNNLATIAKGKGDYETAREYYANVIETATAVGDDNLNAIAHFNLGSLLRNCSELEQAREYVEVSLQTWEEMGDDHNAAIAKIDLGHHTILTGDYDESLAFLEPARSKTDEIGDTYRYASVLQNLGTRARELGAYDEAVEHYQRALETADEIDNQTTVASVQADMACLAYRQEDDERACELATTALDYLRSEDIQTEIAKCLWILGLANSRRQAQSGEEYHRASSVTDPESHLQTGLDIYRELDSEHGQATIQYALGVVTRREGAFDRARESLEVALETFERVGMTHEGGRCRQELGLVAEQTGADAEARTHFEAALDAFLTVGAPVEAAETLRELATLSTANAVESREFSEWSDAIIECARERDIPRIVEDIESLTMPEK